MGKDPVVLNSCKETKASQVASRLANAWVLRVRALSRSGRAPSARGVLDSGRFRDHLAEGGTDLDGEQLAMLIAMLDRLCQADVCGDHQRRTSGLARAARLTISTCEDRRIAPPAIAAPVQGTALCTRDGEGHRSLNELVAEAPGGAGGNKAAGAILHEASPAFAGIRFVGSTVFFRTNDQNSSISTSARVGSCVRMAVKASACSLARRSHAPIVSYLCPVISSAARKLPRRITINSAWATSAAGVCRRYIGVPQLSPKKRPHPRH